MNLEKFLYLLQTEQPCDIGEKGILQSLPSCGIMFAVQKHTQTSIREEELKNRVATVYFGKYENLVIGRAASPRRPNHGTMVLQFDVDADGSASRPYHE